MTKPISPLRRRMIDSVGQPNLGSALAEAAQNTAQAHLDLMKRLLHEFARGQHRACLLCFHRHDALGTLRA